MDSDRLFQQMQFIVEIDKAKHILRQSALTDGSRQENDAEHSWHMAIMTLILAEYANETNLDLFKIIKMLLIHDLVEIDTGDTYVYDKAAINNQHKKEKKAATRIFNLLPEDQATDLLNLWNEFESASTPEAQFAKTLDFLQPLILAYHNRGWSWKTHNIAKPQVLRQKEPMRKGSEQLWKYARELIEKSAEKGYFP